MRSTAVRVAFSTSTASAKGFSSSVTWLRPSLEVASTRSTPTMPDTASSTRAVMSASTSTGVAPRKGTATVIERGS